MNVFWFDGRQYKYEYFREGEVYANERTIELPIFKDEVLNCKRVLEVGNVLKPYYPELMHKVIDTTLKDAVCKDLFEYQPKKQYDLVISVSTLRTSDRLLDSIEKLKELGKRVLISLPLGYTPSLDEQIRKIDIERVLIMKRISKDNLWIEHRGFGDRMRYGIPFENANWMMFLEFGV